MKVALETNLLVRLLTNDDRAQAALVEAWLAANATSQSPAYMDHMVLGELGWMLERSYSYSRTHHEALVALLEHDALSDESHALVRQAFQRFTAGPGDFSQYLPRRAAQATKTVLMLDRRAAKSTMHRVLK